MKIIEPYNLLSTVLTVALWLGGDDYDTVKKCAGAVFDQLKELETIKHPLSGEEIKIVRRSCGDGLKERRSSMGNSSAKSSYPIPEAPEHQSQLGDMKLEARLHVKREETARLETSTGSRRNLLFTRTNSVMCPTEKGTVRESPLERVLDCLHVVFFETGNDRARDN